MTFDGNRWSDAALVPPYAYQPHAPLTAECLSRSLVNSYYQSRHGGRRVLQQTYQWNEREDAASGLGGTSTALLSLSLIDIAEAYADIDDDFTHLRCVVYFIAYPIVGSVSSHRIVADDGTTTVTGATVTNELPAAGNANTAGRWTPGEIDANDRLYSADALVDIRTLTLPATVRVTVQGRTTDSTIAAARVYRPVYVCAWAEVND